MRCSNDLVLINDEYDGWRNRGRSCHRDSLTCKATLAKEIAGPKTAITASLPLVLTTLSLTPPS